jgi:hypothetical protein
MTKDGNEMRRLYDKTVGILQKNRAHPGGTPLQSGIEGGSVAFSLKRAKPFNICRKHLAAFGGRCFYFQNISMDTIDIFQYMSDGSQGEIAAFINGTKGASIPGAVTGYADKQAARLAWRPDRSLLIAFVHRFF